ncbi:MAG: RnfABCDGE type electron transport complex subunit G [Proteobacteria bacterium]|nr:RnfABCDGE type electron transport complex subunit G [Pseudomonadota bacterium]
MRDMIKMVVVITLLSTLSGGLLAYLQEALGPQIEQQKLVFVKGPVLEALFEGAENKPVDSRFKLTVDGEETSFFVGVYDGQPSVVAFEAYGSGFGGNIGVMVAVDTTKDEIYGIGVTTHSETPGLGSRAKTDPAFAAGFRHLSVLESHKVKPDGGGVDALSGATVTSRGVVAAVNKADEIYKAHKDEIVQQAKALAL